MIRPKLLHTLILSWFEKHARILPWRRKETHTENGVREETIASYFSSTWKRDPYRVIISELMLQQTQVDRVIPKFEAFLNTFPTVRDLANAKVSDVLILWKGLGYNRRALFLHKMAKAIVDQYDGVFPKEEEKLIALPGVGKYTARAILAFGYAQDVGVIDTNIKRIFSRVCYGKEASTIDISIKEFERLVDEYVPKGKGDPWNQALMDFGATVCTAKQPQCKSCPLQTVCKANIDAQKNGHTVYSDVVTSERKRSPKKEKVSFKRTDRYFRGKIIDELRNGSISMKTLQKSINEDQELHDLVRFGNIIESLVIDGLIVIHGSTVSLP